MHAVQPPFESCYLASEGQLLAWYVSRSQGNTNPHLLARSLEADRARIYSLADWQNEQRHAAHCPIPIQLLMLLLLLLLLLLAPQIRKIYMGRAEILIQISTGNPR